MNGMIAGARAGGGESSYIVSHTSIRGVAAVMVVLYHLQYGPTGLISPRFVWESCTHLFEHGYLFVDLFFILSGFVISYSMRIDERGALSRSQVKAFAVSRFARIFPLHVFALCAAFGVVAAKALFGLVMHRQMVPPETWSLSSLISFLESLFLLYGLTPEPGGGVLWNGVSWSLSGEVVAYLFFPLLAVLVAPERRSASMTLLAIAGILYAYMAFAVGGLTAVHAGSGAARGLAGFALGMALYANRAAFARLTNVTLSLSQFFAVGAILTAMIFSLNDFLVIPAFCLLIGATWTDQGALGRTLKLPVLHWIGEISFSIYLNHMWIVETWRFLIVRLVKDASPMVFRGIWLSGTFVLVLLVSTLTYRFIEKPARRAIVNFYKRATHRQAGAEISTEQPVVEPDVVELPRPVVAVG